MRHLCFRKKLLSHHREIQIPYNIVLEEGRQANSHAPGMRQSWVKKLTRAVLVRLELGLAAADRLLADEDSSR